jgi:hypothetical protein
MKKKKRMAVVYSWFLKDNQKLFKQSFFELIISLTNKYEIDLILGQKKERTFLADEIVKLQEKGVSTIILYDAHKIEDKSIVIDVDMVKDKLKRKYDKLIFCGCINIIGKKSLKQLYECDYSKHEAKVRISYSMACAYARRLFGILYIMKQHNPYVYQFMIDPTEISFLDIDEFNTKLKQFSYYTLKDKNWNCLGHNYYYDFLKNMILYNLDDKQFGYDFCFGYSAKTGDRKDISTKILDFFSDKPSNISAAFYVDDSYHKINTLIPQDEYLAQLCKSFVTLVIPPYKKLDFSISRFYESIICGCIPIIICEGKTFDKHFKSMNEIFKLNEIEDVFDLYHRNNLIICVEDLDWAIVKAVKKNHKKILNKIKSLILFEREVK